MTGTTFAEPNVIIEHPRFGLGRIKGEALDTFRNQGSTLLAWWPIREEPPGNLSFKGIIKAYKEWESLEDTYLAWSSVLDDIRKSEESGMLMSRPMPELQKKVEQIVKEMVEERVKHELSKEDQWLPEYTGTIEKGIEKVLISSLRTFKTAMMEDDTERIIEAYWEGKRME